MIVATFRGPQRDAALHILRNTPLGETLERLGALTTSVTSSGPLLELDLHEDHAVTLSSGEFLILDWLRSLGEGSLVNIGRTLGAVDRDCQLALIWSLGLATGHFADSTPVRFGVL